MDRAREANIDFSFWLSCPSYPLRYRTVQHCSLLRNLYCPRPHFGPVTQQQHTKVYPLPKGFGLHIKKQSCEWRVLAVEKWYSGSLNKDGGGAVEKKIKGVKRSGNRTHEATVHNSTTNLSTDSPPKKKLYQCIFHAQLLDQVPYHTGGGAVHKSLNITDHWCILIAL